MQLQAAADAASAGPGRTVAAAQRLHVGRRVQHQNVRGQQQQQRLARMRHSQPRPAEMRGAAARSLLPRTTGPKRSARCTASCHQHHLRNPAALASAASRPRAAAAAARCPSNRDSTHPLLSREAQTAPAQSQGRTSTQGRRKPCRQPTGGPEGRQARTTNTPLWRLGPELPVLKRCRGGGFGWRVRRCLSTCDFW